MLKKTISYKDYNDVQRTEDFYFNLDKLEILELEIQFEGGLSATIERLMETDAGAEVYNLFKDIVLKAYGKKSADGKRFMKGDDIALEFAQSPAMAELIFSFLKDANGAADFIAGLLPSQEVIDQVKKDFEEGMANQQGVQPAPADSPVQPADAVITSPEPVAVPETKDDPEKKFEDYTEAELLEMPYEQFRALVPEKPQDMSKDQLLIAMKRKNS